MGRRKVIGICHICNNYTKLSFEHTPPRAAFNDRRTIQLDFEKAVKLDPDEIPTKGKFQQGGVGKYTLCESCNTKTGSWYGQRFVDWCYQGMDILRKTKGNPSLIYLNHLFPLAILKELVTMFFSVNPPRLAKNNPELVRFVLNKNRKGLSPYYRFFLYYNAGTKFRYIGDAHRFNFHSGEHILMSEINYPPFGYVMTLGSRPPDDRLFEITGFSKYSYNEFKTMEMYPKVLPVNLWFPGDYRSGKEIKECYDQNMRKKQNPLDNLLK